MKVDPEFDAIVLSPQELEILGDRYTSRRSALALLKERYAPSEDAEWVAADFEKLEGIDRERFVFALKTLADPLCVAEMHYTIAEHSITRSHLAWAQSEGAPIVVLTRRMDGFALTTRSKVELEVLLDRVLAVDAGLTSANLSVSFSAVTTLVGLALMDVFRFSHLQSSLTHTAPAQSFSALDVVNRIRDAKAQDFRWPLLFFDKVLPKDALASVSEAEVVQALHVLDDAGVILSLADDDGGADQATFAFSEAGEMIAEGLLHGVSKVALRVSRLLAEGEAGHEALLMVRDPNALWLFDVAGQEGVIASLDHQAWKELSSRMLDPQQNPDGENQVQDGPVVEDDFQGNKENRAAATVMQSDLESLLERCPKCASLVKPGNRFCPTCGANLE